MTISQQITDHLKQCHRHEDDSERLLVQARAEIEQLHKAQSYTYIGKNGKPVLARDLEDEIDRINHEMEATKEAARAREAMLRGWVVAFCAPIAGKYAQDFGLPDGHLHPRHYDILEECGARMDDFTRAALNGESGHD